MMITIDKIYTETYIINKSKFISYAYPVFNEDECKKTLDVLRQKYSDATHICFAYILDSPKIEKCSDDGEPSGTAGKPILELIRKKKLSNILVVVIRYFGGIKLGAGGLVRAYTTSGNMALDSAKIIEVKDINKYMVEVSYDDVNRIKSLILSLSGEIKSIEYGEKAKLEFLSEDISNLSNFSVKLIGSEKVCK